ncbi:MAG: RNA methyltransferase [Candidatus Micrarchaeia archaeon]
MKISVAVVEPLYQINLGYIARIMKNFGISELFLINPRCNPHGKQALMYSKHARNILENAKIVGSIEEARKKSRAQIVVGTTGIWRKAEKSLYNIYNPEEFAKRKMKSMLLVLGRDDIGLLKNEISECDALLFIEADGSYPVLNISHALAILLYIFKKERSAEYKFSRFLASEPTKRSTIKLFEDLVNENNRIRDKKAVISAFKHILDRSMPTEKELRALDVALSK